MPEVRDGTPRIGLGWDRHRLEAGRPCVIGGIALRCEAGPVAHSDGDAVLHAVCDALLGAAGEDDLGTLFPDDDPRWRGAAGSVFVEEAMRRVRGRGLQVAGADVVVVCDRPRIGPHRAAIRARLAALLEAPGDRVNLKGKSTEGGAADAIEAYAVVLLAPAPDGPPAPPPSPDCSRHSRA